MALLSVQYIARTGLDMSFAAAASGGDLYPNDGSHIFLVMNSSGSSVTITLDVPKMVDGNLAVADRTFAIEGGGVGVITADPKVFNNADGRVAVSYSSTADISVAVLHL